MVERAGEHLGEHEERQEQEQRAWARRALLEAGLEGQSVHMPLMIGDTPVENGMTFETVRDELYKLMDEGLIKLDNTYRSWTTDKGLAELADS